MKKLFLLAAVAVFSVVSLNAQSLKVGAGVALTVGDFSDGYSFGINLDGAYLFDVGESLQVGPMAGVLHYFGSTEEVTVLDITVETDFDDATFIPVGGSARYMFGDSFGAGIDLAYAIGIAPDGNDGGFMYRPKLLYSVSEKIAIVGSYSGISVDGGTFSSGNLGVEISL